MMKSRFKKLLLVFYYLLSFSFIIILLPFVETKPYTTTNTNHQQRNPYSTIGVERNSNDKEIKRRYRELCLKYHPDKNRHLSNKQLKENEIKFKLIQDAYSKIGTAAARKQYDFLSQYTSASSSRFSTSRKTNDDDYNSNSNNNKNSNSNNEYYDTTSYEDLLRRMFQQQQEQQRYQQQQQYYQQQQQQQQHYPFSTAFPSNIFGGFGGTTATSSPFASSMSSGLAALSSFKSIYVQKVPISLEDLYNGISQYDMMKQWRRKQQQMSKAASDNTNTIQSLRILLHNNFFVNIWKRYTAAFRGRIGFLVLYQALIYSIPFWRFSKVFAAIFAFYIFDRSLPMINLHNYNYNNDDEVMNDYIADILPGYKGGTKFTFKDTPIASTKSNIGTSTVDIVFELIEQQHKIYKRIGNNLHTTIEVTPQDAEDGCFMELQALGGSNDNYNNNDIYDDDDDDDTSVRRHRGSKIPIRIPPGSKSGDVLIIKGYGWPVRQKKSSRRRGSGTTTSKNNDYRAYGDLIVTISIPSFPWKNIFKKR